jgi:hypothetical protein
MMSGEQAVVLVMKQGFGQPNEFGPNAPTVQPSFGRLARGPNCFLLADLGPSIFRWLVSP